MKVKGFVGGVRKGAKFVGAVLVLAAVVGAAYAFWPRHYPRAYLASTAALQSDGTLAPLARAIGFHIGAAVDITELREFEATAQRDFNSMTPCDALKWGNLLVGGKLGQYDFRQGDELVNLARSKQVRIRGHTLLWGRFPGAGHPSDLKEVVNAAKQPKAKLEQLMTEHIRAVLEHFRGRIDQWDVVNEPMHLWKPLWDDNVFYRTLGPDFVAMAFRTAHAADPSLHLVLNEQFGGYDNERAEKFFEIVQEFVRKGVPIHGIGLQSHTLTSVPELAPLKAYVRRLESLGLFVEITELDARVRLFADSPDPYRAQGEYFRAVSSICLEEPACTGLTVWGISDRYTWMSKFAPFKWMQPLDPLLFDLSMRRKPAYYGVAEALRSARATRHGDANHDRR